MRKILLNTCLLFILSLSLPSNAIDLNSIDLEAVSAEIITTGDVAVARYSDENALKTGQLFSRLYFDVFEAKGMEFALSVYDADLSIAIEVQFSRVMNGALNGEDKTQLTRSWERLRTLLISAEAKHHGKHSTGFWSTFWQSFVILLREGFEAILVVTALVTYLRRSGAGDRVNVVWIGVVLALICSVMLAWFLSAFTQSLVGSTREAVEGLVLLTAAGLLVYLSYWLFAKREAQRWQSFINGQLGSALGSGRLLLLGLTAFLAVFREGAETVLFYQALLLGDTQGSGALLYGFASAACVLALLFYFMKVASIKLPLKVFFITTAVLLFAMAFIFAGKGILELQIAGWVSSTAFPVSIQVTSLGLFASWESLGLQALLLLSAVIPFWLFKVRQEKGTQT